MLSLCLILWLRLGLCLRQILRLWQGDTLGLWLSLRLVTGLVSSLGLDLWVDLGLVLGHCVGLSTSPGLGVQMIQFAIALADAF